MTPRCPHCSAAHKISADDPKPVRYGTFRRNSDSRIIQRFFCPQCRSTFSSATLKATYRQKKRQMNEPIRKLLASGISMRRLSLVLNLNRKTIARKLEFLARQATCREQARLAALTSSPIQELQFDDLETFEHTKCKPLSVTLAVEKHTRLMVGFKVSTMSAKGKIAKIALKKYGKRKDTRYQNRHLLFGEIKDWIDTRAIIESDENPHYRATIARHFPQARYCQYPGGRSAIAGQGELKKKKFDPLFSLNHTCAMLRANINRLIRRTWCSTKRPDRLAMHLAIYMEFHNRTLIDRPLPPTG